MKKSTHSGVILVACFEHPRPNTYLAVMAISRRNVLAFGAAATAVTGTALITAPAAQAAPATANKTMESKQPLSCPLGKGK